ncbi:MAG TPA: extracellular solute-binding protein, partial [Spirochaetia bacterium]|nr:extracellular solute-binding protein [Spirochaetia bacterium]
MKQKYLLITVMMSVVLFVNAGGGPVHPDGGGRKVLMWTFARNNLDEWEAREQEIEDVFNIDLQLELVPQNRFIRELQAVMLEGKGAPDIIEWMIENNRILFSDPERCFVLPLNDLYDRSPAFQKVPTGRLSWVTYGGNIYGLPHDVHPVILIYNDTLWKEAGTDVAAIRDWDQFFQAAQRLIAKKEKSQPLHYALPMGDGGLGDTMWMIFQQTGAQFFDKEGNPLFTSNKFKAFMVKWFEWRSLGVFSNWDWGNFNKLLKDGTVCSYTSPDWWVSQVNAAVEDGRYEWRIRDLPLYPGGNGSRTSSWGGSFLAVPKTTKAPNFIFKLVEYMQYGNPNIAVERY